MTDKPRKNKKSWLYRLFNDLYEVKLYHDADTSEPSVDVYKLSYIKKINSTYLKGTDENGHSIEFRSVKPFDYRIKKIY